MPEDVARPLATRRRTEATALPAWIKPQLTKLVDQPPDGSDTITAAISLGAVSCYKGAEYVREFRRTPSASDPRVRDKSATNKI